MRAIYLGYVAVAALALSACGGGSDGGASVPAPTGGTTVPVPAPAPTPTTGGGTSTPVTTSTSTRIANAEMARDFLMRTSWGGSAAQIDALVGSDAADWLAGQFARPPSRMEDTIRASAEPRQNNYRRLWWDNTLQGDADLRSRTVFALSQIVVASSSPSANITPETTFRMSAYFDTLSRHAFGNYRDLLEEVTYNPQMAHFLTYRANRKASDDGSRLPDENYAREILQLFSIGLDELNMDGTLRLDAQGRPVPTYGNEDVLGLARVFTGLSYDPEAEGSRGFGSVPGGFTAFGPLKVWDAHHSTLEKSFLGHTIPANTSGEETIRQAIDHIFDHPNVAPFVATRLIQRMSASSPSPDYVERVATAFETGLFTTASGRSFGTGERGDLMATIAAIHLDPQFFDDRPAGPTDGKIREPILRWAHWAKANEVETLDASNEWAIFNGMAGSNRGLSQGVGQSPSVFNFYRSGFVAPGSASAAAGLRAPELQLVNESALRGYYDYMFDFVVDSTTRRDTAIDSFSATYPTLRGLADDPAAMVDYLDELLISGSFEPTTRQRMIDAITLSPLREDRFDADLGLDTDRFSRAKIAVFMAVTSHEYGVQY